MKVLVTGGAGFIGSHLAEALVERGNRVRVIDDLSAGNRKNLDRFSRRVEFIRGDIRQEAVLRRAVRGVEVVFHQAALRSVPKSVDNPVAYHEVNVTATFHLLRFAKEAGVRRIVYASSSSVYGDHTPLPQSETILPKPQSPYAASKLAMEVYCTMFTRLHGLETVGLRYFNVFGPRQSLENKYAVAVPKFITSLLKGEPPPIHGDGKQTRDFTYVKNVVEANLKAAGARGAAGEVFNVAMGNRHSVLELAKLLAGILRIPIGPKFLPKRPGDVLHTWADVRKARRILRFRGSVGFREGLKQTAEWFRDHPERWGE